MLRRKGAGTASLNAVIAANICEAGRVTTASTRQEVQIVQRDGHTEVREHHSDGTLADADETRDTTQST